MKKSRLILLLAAVIMAAACGQSRKTEPFKALPFPRVNLPGVISSQQEAAEYMAEHYWDAFTDPERACPSNSLISNGVRKEEVEQVFADWVGILEMNDLKVVEKSVRKLCDRAVVCERKDTSSNLLETIAGLAEKYLYDPNSPVRNEEYYLHFARRLSSYEGYSAVERGRFVRQAEMCSLNRLGTVAADFRFADKNGRMRRLHDIKAPMTLLFFSNPGCEACMNIINVLKGEPKVSAMIAQGQLAVLNIYIDEDITAWRDYMPIYPDEWYNGFDPDLAIRTEELYDVRAIPSLYLLDGEKRVMMKDAPEQKVIAVLSNMMIN